MTRIDAIERAIRAIARRVLGEDHSIAALASLDQAHDEAAANARAPADVPDEITERLAAMEEFARAAAEKINYMEAQQAAAAAQFDERLSMTERFLGALTREATNKLRSAG